MICIQIGRSFVLKLILQDIIVVCLVKGWIVQAKAGDRRETHYVTALLKCALIWLGKLLIKFDIHLHLERCLCLTILVLLLRLHLSNVNLLIMMEDVVVLRPYLKIHPVQCLVLKRKVTSMSHVLESLWWVYSWFGNNLQGRLLFIVTLKEYVINRRLNLIDRLLWQGPLIHLRKDFAQSYLSLLTQIQFLLLLLLLTTVLMFLIVFDLCIYTFNVHERLCIINVILDSLREVRRWILLRLNNFDLRLRLWLMIWNNRNRRLLDQILRAYLWKRENRMHIISLSCGWLVVNEVLLIWVISNRRSSCVDYWLWTLKCFSG